jgi:hypothetical protein
VADTKENTMSDTTALPFEMPNFGGPADDYEPEQFDPDDIWIKGFPVGTTQIRIIPFESINKKGEPVYGASAWPTEREHYDQVVYAFPCSEKYPNVPCPGCNSPDSKVRERNRKYYFNALDKDGEQRIFKIGQGMQETFLNRQQRMMAEDPSNKQPLSDRDYHVTRTGSTLQDTKYDPDSGAEYPVEFPANPYDIEAILKKAFERAWRHFNAVPVETVVPPIPDGAFGASSGRIQSKAAAAEAPVQDTPAPAKAAPAAPAAPAGPEDVLGEHPTEEELEDATSDDLKAFLKRPGINVDFPARAARSRLLDLAKKAIAPPY